MKKAEFDDLKQFIVSVVLQSEHRLANRIDVLETRLDGRVDSLEKKFDRLDKKVETLDKKMDEGFAGIGEAVENLSNIMDFRFKNHEKRILKLELKAV